MDKIDKIDKKIFIVKPKGNISDILITISKGIIFSIIFNRNIFIYGYEIHKNIFLNMHNVLDINKIQLYLKNLNINITILNNIDDINTIINYKHSNINNFYKLMQESEYDKIECLNLDNLNNIEIPTDLTNANKLFYDLINIIDFKYYYKNKAQFIKNIIYPNKYISLYLTLTDEWIDYFKNYFNLDFDEINQIYKNKYLKIINDTCDKENGYIGKLYISTEIINSNKNYDYYIELKNKYNFIDKYDFISNEEYIQYGKSNDIIDYIISKNAEFFIGNQLTPFSLLITKYFENNNKYSKLI
jgi:hypothetical protein